MESTARAERFDLQSAASPAYSWEVPLKPLVVRIPFPVIDRLEGEAVDSFRSLDSRGSEIGGVLFGKAIAGEPAIVSIDSYELISCDYSRGPLYRLSDADLARFDKIIAQHAAGDLPVAGFFRSHTRKGLALDAEDLILFESRFKEPRKIALLVRPYATKPSTGGVFFWENGAIHGEASYLEFPFRSSLLTAARQMDSSDSGMAPAGLGGGALPTPTVPKTGMRAQIVPIASRREVAPSIPALAVEPPSAPPETAPPAAPAPASVVSTPPAASPSPVASPKPEKAALPEPAVAEVKPAKLAPPAPAAVAAEPPAKPANTPSVESSPVKPPTRPETRPEIQPESKPQATPVAEVPARQASKLIWAAIGAVVPLILMVVLFIYPALLHRGLPASNAPGDTAALSLRVETLGGEMQLSWNRDSDPIRNATAGVLTISDGDQHQDVAMDLALLQKGSINYTPATSDVVFRLEVSARGQSKAASEMVRALRTRPSPIPDTDSAAGKTAATAAKAPETPAPAATPQTPATQPPPQDDIVTPAPARPVKPFRAESLSERLHPAPATSTDLPDAPTVGRIEANGVPVPALNIGSVAPPPPAPAPAPAKTVPAPPPAEKKAPTPGGQIQQAVLIHRKEPDYPRLARETGAKGTVELVATIGTDGKVKKVTVVKGHPMLVKAASDAVMQWLYKPTILNGVPVEAQTQILITFTADR